MRNSHFMRAFLILAACLGGGCTDTMASRAGADRDAHGCIGSAGYRWCGYTQRCERPWELARAQGLNLSRADNVEGYCAQAPQNAR